MAEADLIAKGEVFGIAVKPRRVVHAGDNHVTCALYVKYNRSWYLVQCFSSHWVKDLEQVTQATLQALENNPTFAPGFQGIGFEFVPPENSDP